MTSVALVQVGISHTAGKLNQVYNGDGSVTIVSGDVAGDRSANFQIFPTGHYVQTGADFIL